MNNILNLLSSFLHIGLFSIGGGYATIPLIQEQAVTINKWLSIQEFTDIITISQMTPGPLAVNTSTFVGMRIAGLLGAAVSTFGCVISGFIISICLYSFFKKHNKSNTILDALRGLKSAATGLIAASAATILMLALTGTSSLSAAFTINMTAAAIMAVSLLGMRKFKLSPTLIIVLSGIAGLLLY